VRAHTIIDAITGEAAETMRALRYNVAFGDGDTKTSYTYTVTADNVDQLSDWALRKAARLYMEILDIQPA
jgi:hypothetical protein